MKAALRGESIRLFSTRLPLWALITALVCGGLLTTAISATGPENATPPMPSLSTATGVSTVLSLISVTLFAPALIGTAAITSEYRHRTAATTFLAVPRRHRVLTAKLIIFGLLGLAYGVVLAAAAVAGILVGAAIHGIQPGPPLGVLIDQSARFVIAATIYMMLGVSSGAIARNQLIAIGITLGYFYLLEQVLMMIPGVNAVYPFLPGGATATLTQSTALAEMVSSQTGFAAPAMLTPAAAVVVLLGYVLLAATLAVLIPLRRDIP